MNNEKITINIKDIPKASIELKDKISIKVPVEHRQLEGLDYDSSGHIGFARKEILRTVKEIPSDLRVGEYIFLEKKEEEDNNG